MPPKVRQRGKKPSKLRKLQQEQEVQEQQTQPPQPVASTSTNQIQSQADFIPFDVDTDTAAPFQENDGSEEQPNWIKLGDRPSKAEHEAPFGYVDPELKGYLRAGWERVVELEAQGYAAKSTLTALAAAQASSNDAGSSRGEEEDDELALLLQATLKEMDGKELLLSIDPDTSIIVEGILHRLPAKPLRVFVDRLAGQFAVLAKHRFGSHVVQACLATLQPAVTLEHAAPEHFHRHLHSGVAPTRKTAASSAYASDTATIVNEDGILRSATQLILDLTEEVSSDLELLASLVTNSFGSHVLRSLLCVLTGRNIQVGAASSLQAGAGSDLRSKRSAKFRTRKAPTAPTTSGSQSVASEDLLVVIPDLLYNRASALRKEILHDASTDTVRRWATDAVASPLLQLLVEAEADSLDDGPLGGMQQDQASLEDDAQRWKGSLVDSLLGGFVSSPPPDNEGEVQKDVYLETSLRDSVASHALQLALERAPLSTASRFFRIYIRNRMAKLCVHPTANHIVAALIRRLPKSDLDYAVNEMGKVATGMVKEQKISCLQAVVDRMVQLIAPEEVGTDVLKNVKLVSDVVLSAFRLTPKEGEDQAERLKLLVPAVLALKTRKAYLHTFAGHLKKAEEKEENGKKRGRDGKSKNKSKKSKYIKKTADLEEEEETPWTMEADYELPPGEATMQGSLLLQSLLRLPGPASAPKAPVKRTFGRPAPTAPPAAPVESFGSSLVLDSLLALPTLTPFATNPVAVHILISSLTPPSPTPASDGVDWVQAHRRRQLSSSLTCSLPSFCGDKYGSRLADVLWYSVDGYSKEKIVKTVIEHSNEILKAPYASYFTNKLNLQLYRKGKVREWNQAVSAQQPALPSTAVKEEQRHRPIVVETKRVNDKRKGGRKDQIDGQLESILGRI